MAIASCRAKSEKTPAAGMDAPLGRALEPVRGAALWVVGWVVAVYSVLAEVLAHWLSEGADSIAPVFLRRKQLLRAMASAASYSEWRTHALELDEIQGNQVCVCVCVFFLEGWREGG